MWDGIIIGGGLAGLVAGYVPQSLSTQPLQEVGKIVLIAPQGLKDFFPEVFAANWL